jgi:hypothetical protein
MSPATGLAQGYLRSSTKTLIGLGCAVVVAVGLLTVIERTSYDTWGALIVGPVLFAATYPMLAAQARREGDRRLLWLLCGALLLRFVGAVLRQYVALDVYGGVADASGYHNTGALLAESFRAGHFALPFSPITGTNFIRVVTGAVYTVFGPTRLGGYMAFGWFSFVGLFLFYRAFTIAVPEGRSRTYARLVFFLPSLIFWPSSIGKEAWMVFALGMAAFGAARLLSGFTVRGILLAGLGAWMAAMVRPHVAGLIGVAIAASVLVRRPSRRLGQLAPLAKAASLVAVVVVGVVFVSQAKGFLEESRIDTSGGVGAALDVIVERTSEGGSEFTPVVVRTPFDLPLATVTVLFRPLLIDAHNVQAMAASVEGTFLLALCLVRWRWLLAAAKLLRRRPYVTAALVYTLLFVIGFSSVANFGILARERVQVLPMLLVLMCVPPARSEEDEAETSAGHGEVRRLEVRT